MKSAFTHAALLSDEAASLVQGSICFDCPSRAATTPPHPGDLPRQADQPLHPGLAVTPTYPDSFKTQASFQHFSLSPSSAHHPVQGGVATHLAGFVAQTHHASKPLSQKDFLPIRNPNVNETSTNFATARQQPQKELKVASKLRNASGGAVRVNRQRPPQTARQWRGHMEKSCLPPIRSAPQCRVC